MQSKIKIKNMKNARKTTKLAQTTTSMPSSWRSNGPISDTIVLYRKIVCKSLGKFKSGSIVGSPIILVLMC
jgi:hypothetical protein